jgi:hypothetical protein
VGGRAGMLAGVRAGGTDDDASDSLVDDSAELPLTLSDASWLPLSVTRSYCGLS